MDSVRFMLEGSTPLLMHNPQSMVKSGKTGLGRKEIPTPAVEAEAGTYRQPDGTLCFPSIGVRNSMLSGAKGYRIGRSAARPVIAGAVLPADPFFPLYNADGELITDFEIDTRRAIVQRQGIMRSRPMVPVPWYLPCVFAFQSDAGVSDEMLKGALNQAGQSVGLGDYRVEKGGWFGRFVVSEGPIIEK